MRFLHLQGWPREILFTAVALVVGFALMPVLIFYAGSLALGRYEGAGVGRMFRSIYAGLEAGSAASWIVLLGPYALYLIFRALRFCWYIGSRPALGRETP